MSKLSKFKEKINYQSKSLDKNRGCGNCMESENTGNYYTKINIYCVANNEIDKYFRVAMNGICKRHNGEDY